jgi:hypothetical protein
MGIVSTVTGNGQFFSVRYNCVINGQSFRPAVCYRLAGDLQKAVEEMVEKELARIYSSEMRFVSGVAYPVKKPAAGREETPLSSSSSIKIKHAVPAAPAIGQSGKTSGSRKGGYTQQGKRDFE